MPRTGLWLAVVLLGGAIVTPARATTIRRMGLDEIVSHADTIVEARVTSVRSFWQGRKVLTEIGLSVTRSYKGSPGPSLTFQQLGGRVTAPVPLTMTVPGAPIHQVGDEGFYFLQPGTPGQHLLVGLERGLVRIRHDDRGPFVQVEGHRRTPAELGERLRAIVAG
ncbi:MAG TPA: hypothetical protein VNL37_01960, partial [Candidatus Polarisedimenticolia bacterium]|nr:hypothetical protein [Candidatus Polarisedimenticolia bacterium]